MCDTISKWKKETVYGDFGLCVVNQLINDT